MASLLIYPAAVLAALVPLIIVRYAGGPITAMELAGAFAAFVSALTLGVLLGLWPIYRLTYFLALFLEADALVFSWLGAATRRWAYYYHALTAQAYIIVLAAAAGLLGLAGPFVL